MRRLIVLGLAAMLASSAVAARKLTVEQLNQALAASIAEHRADADIAHQIGEFELSQRLTTEALDRIAGRFPLQPRTALALQLLADQSAFLDPPPAELPATGTPDPASQQRMLEQARGYVVDIIPRLPNFFATRTTNRFDDTPQKLHPEDWPVRAGLHLVGSSSRTVTFRDGKEVADAALTATRGSGATTPAPDLGLYSFGEFGPVLARALTDLVKGKIEFTHWEQTSLGLAAVYHYQVPKAESHYQVHYCCIVDTQFAGRQAIGANNVSRSRSETNNPAQTTNLKPFDEAPAYHGTLAVDPVTGAILRITLEAELGPEAPLARAAQAVEYGRVSIGEQSYICPIRSMALSVQKPPYSANGHPIPPTVSINESTFTHYHRLGSTARMVADGSTPNPDTASAPDGTNPGQPWTANTSASSSANTSASTSASSPATTSGATSRPDPAPAAQPVAESAPPAPPTAPAAPVIPEISLTAANGVPDQPADAPQTQDSSFSIKVTSRSVDIGVIAYDKKGRPVTDLKPEDFEIYDNGRKQEVRFFSAAPAAAPVPSAAAVLAPTDENFSNRVADTPAAPAASAAAASLTPSGGTILLVDESHIAWPDMSNARQQMMKFVSNLRPGERVGLYTMNGLGFHVLVEVTTDHAALMARLKAFLPSAQSVSQAQEEEQRNRQSFEYVHNSEDLNSVNGNHTEVPDGMQPVDPQLLQMGSNPARASLIILAQVARHLSAIPGHKNLVWVSSDNVLADWENQGVAIDKGPKMIESFAIRAQEAMNEAHASVYPFDVSQLEATAIGADQKNANVELTPAAAENAATAASAGGAAASTPTGGMRNTGMGRITAEVSQDLHPIQGPVRDVAAATGGRTVRRSGDLAGELNGIVDDGHSVYQLSFSPQGPADDKYHAIAVKLTGRRNLTLRYRTGYLFAKEPTTLKERFQQAVWRPTDVGEIGVSAHLTPSGSSSSVKINIAAADLGMEQQAGRWMDKLDIFFIQRDDAGLHAHVEGQTLGLRLRPSTYQALLPSGVPFEHAVAMRPGMASLRVLVVDENSGRMGSITIPAPALQQAQAAPPHEKLSPTTP